MRKFKRVKPKRNRQLIAYIVVVLLAVLVSTISLIPKPAIKTIQAQVVRVVDGDTIEAKIGKKIEKVRFIGVDTPETKHPTKGVEPYGKEASAYTTKSLSKKKIFLELDVQQRDKYGRVLAYVWLSLPSTVNDAQIRSKMFNAYLLLNGYAQLMTIPPNVKYVDYFKKYQEEARSKKRGLWSINPFASAPAAVLSFHLSCQI
ncbi:MAG: thermonuclease family protein [Actinomycetota bacterium]|nr:thermonuclease family protein [Actinomycetota bacterium]